MTLLNSLKKTLKKSENYILKITEKVFLILKWSQELLLGIMWYLYSVKDRITPAILVVVIVFVYIINFKFFSPTLNTINHSIRLNFTIIRDQLKLRSPIKSYRALNLEELVLHQNFNMLLSVMNDNFSYCKSTAPFLNVGTPFTNKSRNPCWWDGGVFRCVPYFYLAGFSKSGTTDLFTRLSGHPSLAPTSKESHWFDFVRFIPGLDQLDNYTDMFHDAASIISRDIIRIGKSSRIIGDATPTISWQSFYWRCYQGNEGLSEPRYTNADVVHRLYPGAKIIFLLREPVNRLYSRYLSWKHRVPHPAYDSPTPERLDSLVMSALEKIRQCFLLWSVRQCLYNGTLYGQMKLRLQESVYFVYLQDWIRVFPIDQLLFIRFEDYINDTASVLQDITKFLGIDSDQINESLLKKTSYGSNRGEYNDIGPMLNSTRKRLEEFYFPFVHELSVLLGDNNYLWHYENMTWISES